ncbi:MAG: DUF2461 domain-containing protein [Gemmatimonadaceae bacterium]
MSGFAGFRPQTFAYLRRLARNNNKAWFESHRDEYEREVRAPLAAFVEAIDIWLADAAPELVGHPRRSLFRIHRDVRFARDKAPYKTNAACWFYHRDAGRGVGSVAHGGAGLYLHVADKDCYVGGGIWMPPAPTLARIRDRLVEDYEGFEATIITAAFRRPFRGLSDDAVMTRVARGYSPTHPAAQWLRYRSFTASAQLSRAEVTSHRLIDTAVRRYTVLLPLVRWLNAAIGFPAAARR